MSTRLALAEALSEHYHAGQFYGVNLNYFQYHISGVVNQMKVHNMNEEALIVAYLHDIIEDTSCEPENFTSEDSILEESNKPVWGTCPNGYYGTYK